MATITSQSNSSKYLSKGPALFQNSDGRRLSAAERLEADKLKYVKSTRARQRRAANDFQSSMTSQSQGSTGTISSGCVSSASPVNDEIDVTDFSTNNIAEKTHQETADTLASYQRMNGADIASKLRQFNKPITRRPRPRSSTAQGLCYLERFQSERVKENTVSTTGVRVSDASEKTENDVVPFQTTEKSSRNSRSVQSKPSSYQRSSSVGPATPRRRNPRDSSHDPVVMSPRSQLKQARQNLKKVKGVDSNEENASNPRQPVTDILTDKNKKLNSYSNQVVRLRNNSNRNSQRTRPFSVIENINRFELSANTNSMKQSNCIPENNLKKYKDTKDTTKCDASFPRNCSAQVLKRRSLDLSHTVNKSLQLSLTPKTSPLSSRTLNSDQTLVISQRFEPTNKINDSGYSPDPTPDFKRTEHRVRLHEDSTPNHFGSKRNLSQALEKIFNPSECDDDMDTAYSSMSPDVSTDSKNLQHSASPDVLPTSGVSNINNALNGKEVYTNAIESNPSSNTINKQSSINNVPSFACANNSAGPQYPVSYTKTPYGEMKHSNSSSTVTFQKGSKPETSTTNTSANGKWTHKQTFSSQPFNRIDLAPSANNSSRQSATRSPSLAPSRRKEVAPEYFTSNPATMNRVSPNVDEALNTERSHATTASASGEKNKPLIDLTASDLNPRRERRSPVPHSTPMKPTTYYEISDRFRKDKPPSKEVIRTDPSFRSPSSTPYSSLKRNPASSRSSSLKRNRPRSKSDVSNLHGELDRFFSTMGMDESCFNFLHPHISGAHVSSESDFSFAGASAYVRDGPDDVMEVDPVTASLINSPAVSVIEKNARVMKWIMSCKKSMTSSISKSGPRKHTRSPMVPPRSCSYDKPNASYQIYAPPVPPRPYRMMSAVVPIESDV